MRIIIKTFPLSLNLNVGLRLFCVVYLISSQLFMNFLPTLSSLYKGSYILKNQKLGLQMYNLLFMAGSRLESEVKSLCLELCREEGRDMSVVNSWHVNPVTQEIIVA